MTHINTTSYTPIAWLFSVVLCLFFAPMANAQKLDSTHTAWSVYTIKKNGQKLCYMASAPTGKNGNYSQRDEPYFLVTHINSTTDEVSASSGYRYKNNTKPRIQIDGRKYRLSITQGELAWAKTSKLDKMLVSRMKKGAKMKVTGTSPKGTYSTDTYSLSGFSKAYKKMKSLCKNVSLPQ